MIVNKYAKGGGGSASGVTPQDVQRQIDSALTPYWESGETKDYVDEAVSGISLDGYYTSAQTDDAIAQAVSGLATEQYVQDALSGVNLDNYWTSAQTENAISAATSGKADAANVLGNNNFQTFARWNSQGVITGAGNTAQEKAFDINGNRFKPLTLEAASWPRIWAPLSAGTAGDILVSKGSGAPVWSAMTFPTPDVDKAYVDSAVTGVQDQIDTMDEVVSAALVDLDEKKVESQDVKHIVQLTQAAYDQLATKDPHTFYIIVNSN